MKFDLVHTFYSYFPIFRPTFIFVTAVGKILITAACEWQRCFLINLNCGYCDCSCWFNLKTRSPHFGFRLRGPEPAKVTFQQPRKQQLNVHFYPPSDSTTLCREGEAPHSSATAIKGPFKFFSTFWLVLTGLGGFVLSAKLKKQLRVLIGQACGEKFQHLASRHSPCPARSDWFFVTSAGSPAGSFLWSAGSFLLPAVFQMLGRFVAALFQRADWSPGLVTRRLQGFHIFFKKSTR